MAAVYLHNSLLSRIQTDPRESLAHSRNFSSLSNAPLLTNTTFHSQPSEPLLQLSPDSATSNAFYDPTSRQPRRDDGLPVLSPWDDSPAHDTFTTPVAEKGRSRYRHPGGKSQQRRRLTKSLLELTMGEFFRHSLNLENMGLLKSPRYSLCNRCLVHLYYHPVFSGIDALSKSIRAYNAYFTGRQLSCIVSLNHLLYPLVDIRKEIFLRPISFNLLFSFVISANHFLLMSTRSRYR